MFRDYNSHSNMQKDRKYVIQHYYNLVLISKYEQNEILKETTESNQNEHSVATSTMQFLIKCAKCICFLNIDVLCKNTYHLSSSSTINGRNSFYVGFSYRLIKVTYKIEYIFKQRMKKTYVEWSPRLMCTFKKYNLIVHNSTYRINNSYLNTKFELVVITKYSLTW